MRSNTEIQDRIDFLIAEMKEMNEGPAPDLFTHMDYMRRSIDSYNELETIYWMLNEPFPESTKLLIYG